MALTVKFIGALRHVTGKPQLNIEYTGKCAVKDLILKIVQETPQLDGTMKTNALILVNDREISVLNGLDTKLDDGDEIVFVPVIHGG
jgi:molybdopterin synthase sulfur carrier subunit